MLSKLLRWNKTVVIATLGTLFVLKILYSTLGEDAGLYSIQGFMAQERQQSCGIDWRNDRVDPHIYEAPKASLSEIYPGPYTGKRKPVKQMYRKPVIELNPDKFLLPVLEYGPNNQLIGFRTAAFVAVRLNRTLVIPKFFKHFSDDQRRQTGFYIYPGHRIDIHDICTFVSCITLDQFRDSCQGKIDAIIHLHTFTIQAVHKLEIDTGMRVSEKQVKKKEQLEELTFLPPLGHGKQLTKTFREFRPEEVEPLFGSEARCVVYPYPLYNLKVPFGRTRPAMSEKDLVSSGKDAETYPAKTLLLSISHHSGTPPYISKVAKDFINSSFDGRPYLAVHWRYNKGDFMNRCKNEKGDGIKFDLCAKALDLKPAHIALAIEEKIRDVRDQPEPVDIRYIYVASPPSERKLVAEVGAILLKKQGWMTYSSIELQRFMQIKFAGCEDLQRHFNDILSTTEVEICAHSYAFLGSERSSWTSNVNVARTTINEVTVHKKSDGSIFALATKQAQPSQEKPVV